MSPIVSLLALRSYPAESRSHTGCFEARFLRAERRIVLLPIVTCDKAAIDEALKAKEKKGKNILFIFPATDFLISS
jgi:hypothetical protein